MSNFLGDQLRNLEPSHVAAVIGRKEIFLHGQWVEVKLLAPGFGRGALDWNMAPDQEVRILEHQTYYPQQLCWPDFIEWGNREREFKDAKLTEESRQQLAVVLQKTPHDYYMESRMVRGSGRLTASEVRRVERRRAAAKRRQEILRWLREQKQREKENVIQMDTLYED